MRKVPDTNKVKSKEVTALSATIEASLKQLTTKSGDINVDTDTLLAPLGYKRADFFTLPVSVRGKIVDLAEKSHGIHWGLPPVGAFTGESPWPSGIILMSNADKSAFYFADERKEENRHEYVVWERLWIEGDELKIQDINHASYDLSLIKEWLVPLEAEHQLANTPDEAKRKLVKETRDKVARTTWLSRLGQKPAQEASL